MRKALLLLCALMFSLPATRLLAGGGDGDEETQREPQRKSVSPSSYPGGPVAKSPLATGYYVTDGDAPTIGAPWAPSYEYFDTTGGELPNWHRVLSGPNQRPQSTWTQPGSEGYEYFRNPITPTDSTNNAFAGPIAIGFPFYYYGRKYDSFYVSTNGLVGLNQRRYQYDEFGQRVAYEPFAFEFSVAGRGQHTGGALADTLPDDYGFQYIALGKGTDWYLRANGGIANEVNGQFPSPARTTPYSASSPAPQLSVLAPLWDDCELPQWNADDLRPDDFGKLYWRRDQSNNKLIIWFVNQSMVGTKFVPILNTTRTMPSRLIRADYQVVLNRSDSSVQYNYKRFLGNYRDPQIAVINVPSNIMFRSNATIGIQSHDQEFTNYLSNADNGGAVYVDGNPANTPHDILAVRFKQWRNITRVLSVTFQVPNRFDSGRTFTDLNLGQLPDNFELLVGHPILGVIRPRGIVENVSSDVGPVNVTPQPIQFAVVFRIRDLVNTTNPPVYQRTSGTRLLYKIENAPGTQNTAAARPNIDTITFDPYFTNSAVLREVGRFRAEVIATDRNPVTNLSYGQQWPFDDTTGVRLFGIRRVEMPFINTFNDYDVSPEDGIIPSVKNFVSIGAEVVDGDANTFNPPPPRGAAGPLSLKSPVARLNRLNTGGNPYPPNNASTQVGDTLLSFPINLSQSVKAPNLFLSYQRAGRPSSTTGTYDRGWSDNTRLGPEQAVYNTQKTGLFQVPDYLIVEFAEPSADGINRITNIYLQNDWQQAGFTDNTPGVITWRGQGQPAPRWGVFGGGGGSDTSTTGKIVTNEFDAGKDFEFYRAYIPIPTRWSKSTTGSRTFRFRIRELAKNDGGITPVDEQDAFYIDNIMVTEPDKPEVEVTAVRVDWPFTEAPASQARSVPIGVSVGNNGSSAATAFGVAMYIDQLDANGDPVNPAGQHNYYRFKSIVSLLAGRSTFESFPTWNAQECGTVIGANSPAVNTTTYRIFGEIVPPGSDSYSGNDKQYTDFKLTLGPTFAYDDGSNDVPNPFANLVGKGLNLVPITQDGNGTQPFGPDGGTTSGTFAMQFRILTRDTLRGYTAYFGSANQSQDNILYSLYQQPAAARQGDPPQGQPVAASLIYSQRGAGTPSFNQGRLYHFDQYVTVTLTQPIVLEPGLYFVTVAQLGQTGLELGADASRMGQVTTIRSDGPPPGVGNYSIPAHPEMFPVRFWYETTTGSGGWQPMLTPFNNPGYPHLPWTGATGLLPPGPVLTYSRGSWIPMIRPYFGPKYSTSCLVAEPVELSSFDLTELASAIRLDWSTSAEVNNRGFNVERRVKGEDGWNTIGYREGAGNSNTPRAYSLVDGDVTTNVTYQYRLRQEDRDGSVSYSAIREGRLQGATVGSATLSQNVPNPFSNSTRIEFNLPENQQVTLEITDALGSVVRTFTVDGKAGANEIEWNGTDASGKAVGSGAYVYKLSGNGFVLVNKMTVTR